MFKCPLTALAESFLCGTFYMSVIFLCSAYRKSVLQKIPCSGLWLLNEIDLKREQCMAGWFELGLPWS